MVKKQEGSLVIIMLGLFWLAGVITTVLYAMTAHITTLVALREVQVQYWHLLQGGMMTALAQINDTPLAYQEYGQMRVLYEGPWAIDPRHDHLRLKLTTYMEPEARVLKGELFDDTSTYIGILWYLAYDETVTRWYRTRGEIVYK